MSTIFFIIIGVIGALWLLGKIAQSTGLDKKAHEMRVQSEKKFAATAEQVQLLKSYKNGIDDRNKIVEAKIVATAESLGISIDEAGDLLFKQCEAHEKTLIDQGHAPLVAASEAFRKVFGN